MNPTNTTNWNELLKRLTDIKRRNSGAILITGAGFSATSGIPTANEFCSLAIRDNQSDITIFHAPNPNYFNIMSKIKDQPRYSLFRKFHDVAKLNDAHRCAAELMISGYIKNVLTVNFDNLMVRALLEHNFFPKIYDLTESSNSSTLKIDEASIFYLHGQVIGNTQLYTLPVIEDAKHIGKISELLSKLDSENQLFIVVGYSGKDPLGRLISDCLKNSDIYWVCRDKACPANVDDILGGRSDEAVRNRVFTSQTADSFMTKLVSDLKIKESRQLYIHELNKMMEKGSVNENRLKIIHDYMNRDGSIELRFALFRFYFENAKRLAQDLEIIENNTLIYELSNTLFAKAFELNPDEMPLWQWADMIFDFALTNNDDAKIDDAMDKYHHCFNRGNLSKVESVDLKINYGVSLLRLGERRQDINIIDDSIINLEETLNAVRSDNNLSNDQKSKEATICSNLGNALMKRARLIGGDFKAAEVYLKRSSELNRHANFALFQARSGDLDGSITLLRECLINGELNRLMIESDDDWSVFFQEEYFKQEFEKLFNN